MGKGKRAERSPAPAPKGRLIPVLGAAALTLVLVAVLCLRAIPQPFPRLEVAGYRITREEYTWAMYQARNDVLSLCSAGGISLKDWNEETPLGVPSELAADRALELLTEFYAVGTLAVERGYLADAGFASMKQDMEALNQKRLDAVAAGQVVTGVVTFELDRYIEYRSASLRRQFCDDPANPEMAVTREDILARYEADKDNLYGMEDSFELVFLLMDAPPEEADALERELRDLEGLAREKGSLALALDETHPLSGYCQELTVDSGNYAAYARSHSDLLAWAEALETGEIGFFRQENRLCLVQCVLRTDHDYVPLESVASVVEQTIRESRYDALIAQRMEQLTVSGDLQALYRYTAEQLS